MVTKQYINTDYRLAESQVLRVKTLLQNLRHVQSKMIGSVGLLTIQLDIKYVDNILRILGVVGPHVWPHVDTGVVTITLLESIEMKCLNNIHKRWKV